LPTYPFERKRLWIDPVKPAQASQVKLEAPPLDPPAVTAVPAPEVGTMAQVFAEQLELMERQLDLLG
jgi:acyl transferase domain-containing protein